MEGHRDSVIGSNEKSWSVDVPFDHLGKKTPYRKWSNWPIIAQNSGFQDLGLYGLELLNGRPLRLGYRLK